MEDEIGCGSLEDMKIGFDVLKWKRRENSKR